MSRQAARLERIARRSAMGVSPIGVDSLHATDSIDVVYNGAPDGYVYELIKQDWQGPWTIGSNPLGAGGNVLPAFMRATQLVADTLAGLPWRMIRDRETFDPPRWISDPQLLRPDGRLGSTMRWPGTLNRMEFWSQVITSQLWYGNAFLWSAETDSNGPRAGYPFLKIINPLHVGYDWDKGYTIDGESVEQTLGGRIIHLRGLAPYDENGFGQGVLQRHAYDLALASQIRDYAVDTLNSGVPHGYLQVTAQNLTKDQAEALKKRWLQEHGNSRSIAVLNATTQFHPLSISPLDAQLIEQKKVSVADIALMFGLDPTFLGAPSGDSATYANVESRQIIFTTHTLTPWARRIEETLSAELPYGTWIEMDMRGLLRGDSNTRKEFYASALEHGWLTVDEVRSIERLPVMPNEPLPAQPQWPGRGPELPAGPVFTDPTVHPEQFTEEKGGGA